MSRICVRDVGKIVPKSENRGLTVVYREVKSARSSTAFSGCT